MGWWGRSAGVGGVALWILIIINIIIRTWTTIFVVAIRVIFCITLAIDWGVRVVLAGAADM